MWSGIEDTFGDKGESCGIYEWQTRKKGCRNSVVYVGSTCRSKEGALIDRILEYCRNGSHKADRINKALNRGYELWVRVKEVARGPHAKAPKVRAESMENDLLDKYNYTWNIRNN